MSSGWIKLHREILDHWVWQDEKYFRWWITILLNVNHETKKFPVNNEIFLCNPGESFRSIEDWSNLFKCSKPTVFKFFELLKKEAMIETKTVGKGNRRKHLITVVKWSKFQETETGNFTESKPETLPKVNPNKNDKNEKNKIYVIFEQFRVKYPGTKGGLETELENFLKNNKPEIVNQLLPGLEKEISHRETLIANKAKFIPEWANLKTWINQKRWDRTFEVKPTNGNHPKELNSKKEIVWE